MGRHKVCGATRQDMQGHVWTCWEVGPHPLHVGWRSFVTAWMTWPNLADRHATVPGR